MKASFYIGNRYPVTSNIEREVPERNEGGREGGREGERERVREREEGRRERQQEKIR